MIAIVAEVVVLLAALFVLGRASWQWLHESTDWGIRRVQSRNRLRLESTAALRCPVHGPQRSDELVLLPSGERVCPRCYAETLLEHRP